VIIVKEGGSSRLFLMNSPFVIGFSSITVHPIIRIGETFGST